nr:hypothetical protein CFP56_78196 [Quercus suber]
MRAEDEFELLKTLWESPEVELQHEFLRAQLALMIQLAGITGNRPGALRRLYVISVARTRKFRHRCDSEQSVDANEPGRNTFPVPDIPSEPCLLLCPQTVLLGLLFADDAFAVPDFSPAQLFTLRIPPGKRELRIPIKQSKAELPLFRKTMRTVHGIEVSQKAVTESWLRERLKDLGTISNFDVLVKPYCFRRGHGEALDSSSVSSLIAPWSRRRHIANVLQATLATPSETLSCSTPHRLFFSTTTFRIISRKTQAAYRGLAPQTAIIRAASGMSRTIDPQRPRSLDEQQLRQADRHPEVVLRRRVRDRMAQQARTHHTTITRSKGTSAHKAYRQAQCECLRTKRAVHKAALKQIKAKYREEQPVQDILCQLKAGVAKQLGQVSETEPQSTLSSERRRVLVALLTFASTEPMDDQSRRVEAIEAVRALCKRQEDPDQKICRTKKAHSNHIREAQLHTVIDAEDSKVQQDPFPVQCLPTQCVFCMGNNGLSLAKRTKQFRDRAGLRRHFFRKHLQYHDTKQRIRCPHPKCCNEWLEHTDHLRNHAATVHKTLT